MKFPFSILSLVIGFLITSAIFNPLRAFGQEEPTYGGKTVSVWVGDLNYKTPKEIRSQAQEALRQIGTNSLPFLLAEMHTLGDMCEKYETNDYPPRFGRPDC